MGSFQMRFQSQVELRTVATVLGYVTPEVSRLRSADLAG